MTRRALLAAAALSLLALVLLQVDDSSVGAAEPQPSQADTGRLLGYMWADGSKDGNTWDVNGPSGTSTLIEYLVEAHGGTWVNRSKLQFRLPDPYNWPEWTDGLPDDSDAVRKAVQTHHFLGAVLEAEASVEGTIYDQAAGDGYTVGRLEELKQLLRDKGMSTAKRVEWNTPDRGQVTLGSADFVKLRQTHRFVCPASGDAIRLPGGENYGRYGDLRWFTDANRWAGLTRNDCRGGVAISPVPAPAGTCAVSVDGNDRVTVTWTFTRGNVVIRRDNAYVEAVSVLSPTWSETRARGTWSYSVRVFAGGEQADASCGTVSTGGAAPPVQPPVAPAGGCVAKAAGGDVQLSWDDFGVSTHVIRRNGKWVDTVSARSATVSGNLDDLFVIRRRSGGQVIDVTCVADGVAPAGPCTLTPVDGGVRVDLEPIDGVTRRIIRVNGKWAATLDGVTSFTQPGGDLDDTWLVRHRVGAERIDLPCA